VSVKWTKDQRKVIELRNRNMLVSAAAGSGKTAVLVERILSMLTDKKKPIDIDRLLIVTFTRAAAGEMKERIGKALYELLDKEPENEHLQRQVALLGNAQINTIDGYCSYLVRNYFHTIGIDPGFRIADEGELKLLRQEVVEKVIEEAHEKNAEEFVDFVESYATGKADTILEELILELYQFSTSAPYPKKWLMECERNYEEKSLDFKNKSNWINLIWAEKELAVKEGKELLQQIEAMVLEPGGPYMYQAMLDNYKSFFEKFEELSSYREVFLLLSEFKYPRLSPKKDPEVNESLKECAKERLTQLKEMLKSLQEDYFMIPEDIVSDQLEASKQNIGTLVELTLRFWELFKEAKKKKNICDFSDIEHYALDILVKPLEENKYQIQPPAFDLANTYEEIMIDEYQDSNLVQEMILTYSSKAILEKQNIFMVGDVKQSIYRFRLARPELFMEKLETYTLEDSPCQRVDLHKNFRSRQSVLDFSNYIFSKIMKKSLGSVEYDEAAKLNYGGLHKPDREFEKKAEVLCLLSDDEGILEETSSGAYRELEARMLGQKIRDLVGKEEIFDNKLNSYRKVKYSDCVILLRTLSGWSDTFVKVLKGMNIPAFSTSKEGYFSAPEVVTVLNYLHICDNPLQDIPLASVLLSPMVGLSDEQLAKIKTYRTDGMLFDACKDYLEYEEKDEGIFRILKNFFEVYEKTVESLTYLSIHELILSVLKNTGYSMFATALAGGDQRSANLKMLVEKAVEFEKTSYHGLFQFIRYIEYLQKYQIDFGEVSVNTEDEDAVRIMSIHKSKGLEFPIVFVAGMGKKMNQQDSSKTLICHGDYGIALPIVDLNKRTKTKPLIKTVLAQKIKLETMGEELRVLYVAFTRAREKLFITGNLSRASKKIEEYKMALGQNEETLSYNLRKKASTYWDWLLPCLLSAKGELYADISYISVEDLLKEELSYRLTKDIKKESILNMDTDIIYDEKTEEIMRENFSYKYPYRNLERIPAKISVSELKKRQMGQEEAYEKWEIESEGAEETVPSFMRQEEESLKGALKGTAYHRLMECMDYEKINQKSDIANFLEELYSLGKMDKASIEAINKEDIWCFVSSSLGKRMRQAQKEKRLYLEQPFVLGMGANQIEGSWDESEEVLVQGIIDAYFYEENEIVLLDYKTDKVSSADELVKRYHGQLDYYSRALESLTKCKVKEKFIYSFKLGEMIKV